MSQSLFSLAQNPAQLKSFEKIISEHEKGLVRKNLFIVFCLNALILFGAASSSFAQIKDQAVNAEDLQKQREAEQVVIRAMKIFGQTLNFEDVYRATYVKDKKFRENVFDAYLKDDEVSEFLKSIDKNSAKAYSNISNNMFWLILFSGVDVEGKEWKRLQRETSLKLNRRQRILFNRTLKDIDENNDAQDINQLTKAEASEILPIWNIALNVFRKRFARKIRQTTQYNVEISLTRKIFNLANENTNVYKNPYGITIKVNDEEMSILFTVVEESGVMKILSIKAFDD